MTDILNATNEQRIAERLMLLEGLDLAGATERTRDLHEQIAAYMADLPTITVSQVAEAIGEPLAIVDLYLQVRFAWQELRDDELEAEVEALKREAEIALRENGEVPEELRERRARLAEEYRALAANSLRRAIFILRYAVRQGDMSEDEAQAKIEEIVRELGEDSFDE